MLLSEQGRRDAPLNVEDEGLATWRLSLERILLGAIEGGSSWVVHHWLLLANLGSFLVLVGAVLAPYLRSVGLAGPAQVIYTTYLIFCGQRPSHSYFLFGQQMALEQRMVAMFAAQLLAGLAYLALRRRLQPLSWRAFALLSLPILVDGFSQTFGFRESDAFWRTISGAIFNVALVWALYPRAERLVGKARRGGSPSPSMGG